MQIYRNQVFNERPTYLPPSLPPAQKRFSDFYENLQKFKLEWMNVRKFGKYVKTIMYRKKIRLQVENRGYFWKKKFSKLDENLLIDR